MVVVLVQMSEKLLTAFLFFMKLQLSLQIKKLNIKKFNIIGLHNLDKLASLNSFEVKIIYNNNSS